MKVSEVTVKSLAEYLRLDIGDYTDVELQVFLTAAKSFIKSYTGLNDAEVDSKEEFTVALYVLCQDMYDNRSMYVEKSNTNVNRVVESILGMHRTNLLPSSEVYV